MRRALPLLGLNAVLVVGALLTLAPLLWMVSASFMPAGQANSFPPPLLPHGATLANYVQLFTRLNLARAFGNSLFVAVLATLISLLTN